MTVTADPDERPAWWVENERIRDELELPAYEPPRLEDGRFLHSIVTRLQERYGVHIRIYGKNTEYPDDLTLSVDGQDVGKIGRYRDGSGNTVFTTDTETFTGLVTDAIPARSE